MEGGDKEDYGDEDEDRDRLAVDEDGMEMSPVDEEGVNTSDDGGDEGASCPLYSGLLHVKFSLITIIFLIQIMLQTKCDDQFRSI